MVENEFPAPDAMSADPSGLKSENWEWRNILRIGLDDIVNDIRRQIKEGKRIHIVLEHRVFEGVVKKVVVHTRRKEQ
jgi:hypothetical protein